jgi:hypothetical protein
MPAREETEGVKVAREEAGRVLMQLVYVTGG